MSEIFSLEYEKVLDKVNKNVSIVNIVKKQPKEITDKLRKWIDENNISSRHKYR